MPEFMTLMAEGRAAALDRRFDEAAAKAERLLASVPSCLPALRLLAWAQLELGDDRALVSFQQCAELDPEDALAQVGQAIWSQQRDQRDQARRCWTRAWELEPHNQPIRRALVRLTGELPESALADGVGLLRAGRLEEAAEALRRAATAQPPDVAPMLALMTAVWGLGGRRQAFDLAVTIQAAHPHCVRAMLYVAALEDSAGRTLRSRELIARAEQADPGLVLFADTVHELGLQASIDSHRASRLAPRPGEAGAAPPAASAERGASRGWLAGVP